MIIGHIADTHLGVAKYSGNIVLPPGATRRELGLESHASVMAADAARMLEESIDLLHNEGVREVVLAGDVFDVAKPSNRDLAWAAKFFSRTTRDYGINYIVTAGDHDTPGLRDATPLDALASTIDGFYYPPRHEVLRRSEWRSLRVEVGGTVFYTMPFIKASKEKRSDAIRRLNRLFSKWREADRSKPVVLVAHYGLRGFTHEDDAVGNPEELPPVDYAAMGHVHARHIILEGYPAPFAYPGSLIPVTRREALRPEEERGPLIVELEPGSKPSVKPIIVELPRCYLTVKAGLDSIAEAIEAARKGRRCPREPAFVHLTVLVRDSSEAARRNLRSILEGVARDLNVIVRVHEIIPVVESRDTMLPIGDLEAGEELSGEDVELEVIASRLAGDRDLARLVLELKEKLASNEMEKAEEIALQLLSRELRPKWAVILAGAIAGKRVEATAPAATESPLHAMRAASTKPSPLKPRSSAAGGQARRRHSSRRRVRGLDAFLGGE